MLSPKSKRNLYRIVPFALIWLFFSIIYTLLEKGILGNLHTYPATGNPYHFDTNILITPLTALITGSIIGAMEIGWLNKLFFKNSFTQKILFKTLIYLAFIITFLLALSIIANAMELQSNIFSKQVWNNMLVFFTSFAFWSVALYIAAIIALSLFYLELSENLGLEVLNNYFTGKYHKPTEEVRIFMFSDIRSSTTIAESLGHVKYFEMIREYFSDLSDSIVKHEGEIYQYVGDEIVVSWNLKKGLKGNNCIQCYYSMKASIKNQENKYHKKFGTLPDFKAGFHFGKVTTGEIGVIKKEITFSGDVLNTTARIQELCNAYQVDILISEALVNKIQMESQYKIIELGENALRGRDEKIKLFTIQTD